MLARKIRIRLKRVYFLFFFLNFVADATVTVMITSSESDNKKYFLLAKLKMEEINVPIHVYHEKRMILTF